MTTELQLSTWEPAVAENFSLDKKHAAVKMCVTGPDWLRKVVVQVPKGVAVGVLFCGGSFDIYFLKHS